MPSQVLTSWQFIIDFASQTPAVLLGAVFVFGLWLVPAQFLIKKALEMLADYKAGKYTADWEWVVLAIDIPQDNVQTPKAVEQLFAHIYSVMEPATMQNVYRRGWVPHSFSFEIVSIEGYIQFLVRCLDEYRDVLEAAMYAQYPAAEITEVEDYTENAPDTFPNETHHMFATDFGLTDSYAFPIRMYQEFEHNLTKDETLKDPMGTFLESFTRIGRGEQIWYQIIVEPVPDAEWKTKCIKKIKELIGEPVDESGGLLSGIGSGVVAREFAAGLGEMRAQILGGEVEVGSDDNKRDEPNKLSYLTPGQKKLVERMEEKIEKIGFKTKVRAVYVAEKEAYRPSRGVNSLVGAINQFNSPSSNSLVPAYTTAAQYFRAGKVADRRRNELMEAYKKRDVKTGADPYVFNIEELATLWHFPMSTVRTPLLQKARLKQAEPPTDLPVEHELPGDIAEEVQPSAADAEGESEGKRGYQTDAGDMSFYDDGLA